jgi:hypothetical protein
VKNSPAPSIFDESHYSSPHRPPGPQFLFDLGLYTPSLPLFQPTHPHLVWCRPAVMLPTHLSLP